MIKGLSILALSMLCAVNFSKDIHASKRGAPDNEIVSGKRAKPGPEETIRQEIESLCLEQRALSRKKTEATEKLCSFARKGSLVEMRNLIKEKKKAESKFTQTEVNQALDAVAIELDQAVDDAAALISCICELVKEANANVNIQNSKTGRSLALVAVAKSKVTWLCTFLSLGANFHISQDLSTISPYYTAWVLRLSAIKKNYALVTALLLANDAERNESDLVLVKSESSRAISPSSDETSFVNTCLQAIKRARSHKQGVLPKLLEIPALSTFPPGLLPFIVSFLGLDLSGILLNPEELEALAAAGLLSKYS